MNVALNLLQLSPGRTEGIVTYVRQLAALVPEPMGENRLIILQQPGLDLGSIDTNKIKVICLERPRIILRIIGRGLTLLGLNSPFTFKNRIHSIIDRNKIDIVHYPFSSIPAEDMELNSKIVLSIMDLQHEYLPELFSTKELKSRRAVFLKSAQKADIIISISDYTKKTIVEKFNIPEAKITTIPLAGDTSPTPKNVAGLPNDYMFFPAADWHHKNHMKLLEALGQLKNNGFNGKLVLTGHRSEKAEAIHTKIAKLGLTDDVIDLGSVSFDELAYVFSKAKMLIYPSRFEGFGIPPLEAMSIGLPVACSGTTSLPEIVGDAAEMFNPESVDEIVASILKVWDDKTYRAKLKAAGYKQAAKFSWKRTAEDTYKVYRETYEKNK